MPILLLSRTITLSLARPSCMRVCSCSRLPSTFTHTSHLASHVTPCHASLSYLPAVLPPCCPASSLLSIALPPTLTLTLTPLTLTPRC